MAADLLRPRLVPVQPGLKVPYPVTKGGPRWGELGPASDNDIDRWYNDLHPAWGVRTGLISGLSQGALVVFDVNDPDAAPDWVDDLDLFPWRIKTPRGVHLYSWSGEPLRTKPLDYGDLKATGIVVHHQPAGTYRPLPGFGEGQLPLWPASILADLLREPAPLVFTRPERPQDAPDGSVRLSLLSPVRFPVGRRNVGLFDRLLVAAGRDGHLGGDPARLLGLARWYNSALDSPLGDDEVRKLAASAAGYSEGWRETGHTDAFNAKQRTRGQRSGVARRAQAADRAERVRAFKAQGLSVSEIARQLGITRPTVYRGLRGD